MTSEPLCTCTYKTSCLHIHVCLRIIMYECTDICIYIQNAALCILCTWLLLYAHLRFGARVHVAMSHNAHSRACVCEIMPSSIVLCSRVSARTRCVRHIMVRNGQGRVLFASSIPLNAHLFNGDRLTGLCCSPRNLSLCRLCNTAHILPARHRHMLHQCLVMERANAALISLALGLRMQT